MASGFMSLAYLAEISVVFNLAFGEFKSSQYAKKIDDKFSEITKLFPDGINFSDEALGIEKTDTDFFHNKPTWLLSATKTIESIRLDRIKREDNYSPLAKFHDRAKAFATNPNNAYQAKMFPFWKYFHGFLASWIYSKTEDWNYPFCNSSLIVWTISSIALILIGLSEVKLFNASSSLQYTAGYFFCGFLLTFTISRPLTYFYAKTVLGSNCVAPRAKYYNFILTFVSTIALILIIFLDHHHVISDRIWFFLVGFFIGSVLSPLFMLIAHYILDACLENWKVWADIKAKKSAQNTAKKSLQDIENITEVLKV
jgi:hypothetical protein